MKFQYYYQTDTLGIFFCDEVPALTYDVEYKSNIFFLRDEKEHFIGIAVRHASKLLPAPEDGPEWSESEIRAWLITNFPEGFKLRLNKKWLREHLAALQAQGVEITPHLIPGIVLHRIDPSKN